MCNQNYLDLTESDRRWLYKLPIPVTVTSYESIRTDFYLSRLPTHLMSSCSTKRSVSRTARSRALAARRVSADRRWLLSATPLENGVGDLGSLAEVLRIIDPRQDYLRDPGAVREAFQGNFLRRRKRDVLPELPPMIQQEIPLRLADSQLKEYENLLQEQDWNGSVADLLSLITRLKMVCNRASDGESIKLDALRVILDDPSVEPIKVIVISQFATTLEWLASQLKVKTYLFTGGRRGKDRDAELQNFRESTEPAALLLSLKAGGVGLNIVEASHVVLFDRWWTPAAEEQAIARAHRFGRESPLLVYSFRVVDSVEDRIVEVAQSKAALFDELVDGHLTIDAEAVGWSRRELLEC